MIIRFLLRRTLSGALTLFVISLTMFILFYVAPNDPARTIAGPQATFDVVEQIQRRLGLDQPLPTRFGQFLGDLVHGDLGYSYYNQRPVRDVIFDRLPITASVAIGAAVMWMVVGIPLGVASARRPGSKRDRAGTAFVLAGLSFPTFVVGLLLLYLLFFRLTLLGIEWFPAAGYVPLTESPFEWARHLFLPWVTIAFSTAATYARLTRGQMLEVFGEDYIRTARAKGLSERRVVYRHALRTAVTPLFTQFGLDVALLLGGLVVTEQVFGLQRDRPPGGRLGRPRRPADHHRHGAPGRHVRGGRQRARRPRLRAPRRTGQDRVMATLRERLATGGPPVLGTWVNTPSPDLVETLGLVGFDVVMCDLEHGEYGTDALPDLLRAARAAGCAAMVRTSHVSAREVAASLDAGADGVLAPGVGSVAEATRRRGGRPLPAARRARGGADGPGRRLRHGAVRRTTASGPRPASSRACRSRDPTGSRPSTGSSASPGSTSSSSARSTCPSISACPGETGHPAVVEAMTDIVERARQRGVATGTWAPTPAAARQWIDAGVRLVTVSSSTALFTTAAAALLAELRPT